MTKETCRSCTHFRNDPAYLEQAIPGIRSMGSAWASVRGDDGLCEHRGCYLSARAWCADYRERTPADEPLC